MGYNFRLVSEVKYNWFYSTGCGEEYQSYKVDGECVKEIRYHAPDEHDSEHYCDVVFIDDITQRIFNINFIEFI